MYRIINNNKRKIVNKNIKVKKIYKVCFLMMEIRKEKLKFKIETRERISTYKKRKIERTETIWKALERDIYKKEKVVEAGIR